MECAVCNQDKIREDLFAFSQGAYGQIFSNLNKINDELAKEPPEDSPIHVCLECVTKVHSDPK